MTGPFCAAGLVTCGRQVSDYVRAKAMPMTKDAW